MSDLDAIITRARALCWTLQKSMDRFDDGLGPRGRYPLSSHDGYQLAELVRELATCLKEHDGSS
jgi:hypothetical protein